jgi:hypothetical protein
VGQEDAWAIIPIISMALFAETTRSIASLDYTALVAAACKIKHAIKDSSASKTKNIVLVAVRETEGVSLNRSKPATMEPYARFFNSSVLKVFMAMAVV